MSNKKLYCYTFDIMKNGKSGNDKKKIKLIIDSLFNIKNDNVSVFENGNKALKFDNNDDNYFSLELLNTIKNEKIPEEYLFFRIGRQKELEGALKRQKATFMGEEILDKKQQEEYELEICTYILIDIESGIAIELFGQFAPSTKHFFNIVNAYLDKNFKNDRITVLAKNIMTDKMIETYKDCGVSLNEIGYKYNIPDVEALKYLGLDTKQIAELKKLDVFEIKISIKNRPRLPLTKFPEKIKYTVGAFKECAKDIKDTIKFKGSTEGSGSQEYKFHEDIVTYSVDISNYKIQDSLKIKLDLDELAEQAYIKIKTKYESNKNNIEKYILKE